MEQLDNQQVEALLDGLSGWRLGHDSPEQKQPDIIYRKVSFGTFTEGIDLAQRVASALAGSEDHVGLSVYGFQGRTDVTLMLRTFSQNRAEAPFGVTEQDIALARAAEAVLPKTT